MKLQTIYDVTMSLIDERKNNGDVDTNSTKDYLARTPGIATILQTEIVMELTKVGAKVSSLDEVKTMTTDIDLDDDICLGIFPYGLASRLLITEDSTLASYFDNLYSSKITRYISDYRKKSTRESITDYYNSSMEVGV